MYLRSFFFLVTFSFSFFLFNHWTRYHGNELSVIHLELVRVDLTCDP